MTNIPDGSSENQNKKLLLGLQYLRAAAALSVVFYHAGGLTDYGLPVGQAGVDLFFILSGFLMVSITEPGFRPLRFLGDRVRRIVPVYWLATTAMLIGGIIGLFPKLPLEPWHILTSYFFIPCWSPAAPDHLWPLLVPGWTLNYEAAFYVIFAATGFIASQVRQLAAVTILFVCLVILGWVSPSANPIYAAYTDPILLEFAAGGWLGLVWKRRICLPRPLGWSAILLAIACLTAANDEAIVPWRAIVFGLPCLAILISILAIEQRGRIRPIDWMLSLGDASYSIYLWHPFAISVAKAIGHAAGLPQPVRGSMGLLAGTAVGCLGYLVLEKPILQRLRRKSRPVVALPDGVLVHDPSST